MQATSGYAPWEINAGFADPNMLISRYIKRFRKCMGWSQEDYAAVLEVGVVTVQRWEQGRALPDWFTLYRTQVLELAVLADGQIAAEDTLLGRYLTCGVVSPDQVREIAEKLGDLAGQVGVEHDA